MNISTSNTSNGLIEYDLTCIDDKGVAHLKYLVELNYDKSYFTKLINIFIDRNKINAAETILDFLDVPKTNMNLKQRLCYLQLLGN